MDREFELENSETSSNTSMKNQHKYVTHVSLCIILIFPGSRTSTKTENEKPSTPPPPPPPPPVCIFSLGENFAYALYAFSEDCSDLKTVCFFVPYI